MLSRSISFLAPVLAVALLVSACSSKSASSTTRSTAAPTVLPRAATADVWANRIVNTLFRPLQEDLAVVSSFDSPRIRIYIQSGNQLTLRTIRRRMNDLSGCSTKLVAIGPPPPGNAALAGVSTHLGRACTAYVELAQKLSKATDMLASGREDVVKEGDKVAAEAGAPSRRAAQELAAAIRIAERQPSFRRAGLTPSV